MEMRPKRRPIADAKAAPLSKLLGNLVLEIDVLPGRLALIFRLTIITVFF